MTTKLTIATLFTAAMAMAQVMIPDGTKIRVRLEQNLSSEDAVLGQTVDFAVTQEVRVGDAVVVANGARATGAIVRAQARRRMGRGGELDFTIDRVQMVDGNWLNVRYTPHLNHGHGNGATTGVLTAGLAVVFWPAAPLGLLVRGHDAFIIKGRTYEVFADESTYVANAVAASVPPVVRVLPQAPAQILRTPEGGVMNNYGLPAAVNVNPNPVQVSNTSTLTAPMIAPMGAPASQVAMLSVNANIATADIEIDGAFVGNAPTTIQLAPGQHQLVVRSGAAVWQRDVTITSGTVTINATLARAATQRAAK